jgi:ubiquinol-cytochrome c reductase cytochrome b subunit
LPFVVTALVVLHIFFLHSEGSSNPIGVRSNTYKVAFHYNYRVKDSLYFFLYIWLLVILSLTLGYSFMDAENFIPANPLVTPAHIQPEWYFLFAYAILRSIPNKLGGVVGLLLAILVFFVYPFIASTTAGGIVFSPLGRVVFWGLVVSFLLLT